MGARRLRTGLVLAAAAATVLGTVVAPGAATAAAAAPTGLSPSGNAEVKNVVLRWNPVPFATSYQVQISDRYGNFDKEDSGSSLTKPSVDVTTTLTSYAPSAKLVHAGYRWRVRAADGVWSDPERFIRDWDGAPGNPRTVSDNPMLPNSNVGPGPVLTWDALPDASYYEVQYSPYPFVPGTDPTDGGDGGTGSDDGVSSCVTASTVFTPYKTVVGESGGIIDDTTVKCIEASEGAELYWRVRGRDGTLGAEPLDLERPAVECSGVYYGEKPAATIGGTDDCSDWAYPATPTFVVDKNVGTSPAAMTVPANPRVTPYDTAPGNMTVGPYTVTSNPTYDWDPVPGASFYRVYLSPDIETSAHYYRWETTATSLSPVLQDPDSPNLQGWRVEACTVNDFDDKGFLLDYDSKDTQTARCGNSTAWQTFTKITPKKVQNVSATSVTGGKEFVWTTALDATKPNSSNAVRITDVKGYRIEISDNRGSFVKPAAIVDVDREGTTSGQARAAIQSKFLPSGFKWRVRGIDSKGREYPWSTATTVGTLAGATASLTTKSNFALTSPINFTFDTDVDGVTSSTARIVNTSNGAAHPGSVHAISARGYQFRPASGTRYVPGESYRLQLSPAVQTIDTSVSASTNGAIIRATGDLDSSNSVYTKVAGDYGWSTARASDAFGNSYLRSNDKAKTSKRSYVQVKVRGKSATVYGCVGPRSGYARIYVDGATRATVNLYKSSSRCKVKLATVSLSSGKQQTVRFAPIGTKVKKSKSTNVRFDRMVVS